MITQYNSILCIESHQNKNFGTGCVIHNDKEGSYILTTYKLLKEVKKPIFETQELKIIAQGESVNLALLYLKGTCLPPLPLQINNCLHEKVKIVGFTHFGPKEKRKRTIHAFLYRESIDVHSLYPEGSCSVRKVLAREGFYFERENAGAPIFCSEDKHIIALVGEKEKNNIAYTINIASLKSIWQKAPDHIFQNYKTEEKEKPQRFYYLFLIPSLIFTIYFLMRSIFRDILQVYP